MVEWGISFAVMPCVVRSTLSLIGSGHAYLLLQHPYVKQLKDSKPNSLKTLSGLEKNQINLYSTQGCGSGSGGNGPFSVEAEARKFYRFCFHVGYLT